MLRRPACIHRLEAVSPRFCEHARAAGRVVQQP
ncbi:hypothetical protein CLU85_1715 [Acidovorax sp. 69]|nr:hypothetical protein CLU85_1715 [Acidovorax sp. 69]